MKLIERLQTDPPMLTDGALSSLLMRCSRFLSDPLAAEHPDLKAIRARLKPSATVSRDGQIAIVPVVGMLARKPDVFELLSGVEDTSVLHDLFNSVAHNAGIQAIVLDIDSPGGFVTGGPEFADAVRQATKTKPVVAFTSGSMASLAYYIGSQANAVIATRSAQVGCIGTFMTHIDYSRMYEAIGIKVDVIKNKEGDFKAAGVFGTALSPAQSEDLQKSVQRSFEDFRTAVTTARPQVQEGAMRGQTFEGKAAKDAGLIDSIGDLGFAVSTVRKMLRDGKQFQ